MRKSANGLTAALTLLSLAHLICGTDIAVSRSEQWILQEANITSKCGLEPVADRLVVAARYKENISWMPLQLDVPFLVYQADRRGIQNRVPHKHSNSGREASAFLMFIAEYYDCLPEMTAFVHGHRGSWHNPDVATDLRQLYWDRVEGYLPLSRKYFESFGPWFWSFPSEPERHLQNPIATGEAVTNGSFLKQEIYNGTVYEHDNTFHWQQAKDVANAWEEFFGPAGLGPLPAEVRYFCCAQFVTRKEQIRRHPRSFYLQAIHWLDNSPWKGAINPRYSRGLVFETLWHVIMGQAAIMVDPSVKECQLYKCKSAEPESRAVSKTAARSHQGLTHNS